MKHECYRVLLSKLVADWAESYKPAAEAPVDTWQESLETFIWNSDEFLQHHEREKQSLHLLLSGRNI